MEGVTDSMKITNYTQEFITDDNKPFDSAHASTLLELKDGGILAAWFGGAWEKNPDVAIWTAIRDMDGWGQPGKGSGCKRGCHVESRTFPQGRWKNYPLL